MCTVPLALIATHIFSKVFVLFAHELNSLYSLIGYGQYDYEWVRFILKSRANCSGSVQFSSNSSFTQWWWIWTKTVGNIWYRIDFELCREILLLVTKQIRQRVRQYLLVHCSQGCCFRCFRWLVVFLKIFNVFSWLLLCFHPHVLSRTWPTEHWRYSYSRSFIIM
jgi:hypothetical protein